VRGPPRSSPCSGRRVCCPPTMSSRKSGREWAGGSPIERVFREQRRRLLATLIRLVGDIDAAEEGLAAAWEAAVVQWPALPGGAPDNPGAWLIRTARNKAVDGLRHRALAAEKHAELQADAVAAGGEA